MHIRHRNRSLRFIIIDLYFLLASMFKLMIWMKICFLIYFKIFFMAVEFFDQPYIIHLEVCFLSSRNIVFVLRELPYYSLFWMIWFRLTQCISFHWMLISRCWFCLLKRVLHVKTLRTGLSLWMITTHILCTGTVKT